jgi:hypothetical protein
MSHVRDTSTSDSEADAPLPDIVRGLEDIVVRPDSGRRLLILDVNGVLVARDERHHRRRIPRPWVTEFLTHCYSRYHVAFWTTMNTDNAYSVLDRVLTLAMWRRTAFIWTYDRDRDRDADGSCKRIATVLASPTVNADGHYGLDATVICDDSEHKMRHNNDGNVVLVETATADERASDGKLRGVLDRIEDRFRWMAGKAAFVAQCASSSSD